MNRFIAAAFLLLLGALPSFAKTRPAAEKPNIIIVYLDDAGYGDFGFTGNKDISTPNLDKLAAQSLQLNGFYAGSPACSASRYAIMTGKSPARSGFSRWVLSPRDKQFLNPAHTTIAETLKKADYRTGIIGKWHLGLPTEDNEYNTDSLPASHGFDTYVGIPYSNDMTPTPLIRQPGNSEKIPSAEIVEQTVNQQELTQFYFKEACKYITQNKDKPFFLYLATSMPHVPLFAGKRYQGKSKSKRLYDDVIEEIDACMGELVKTVDKNGLGENTLIIFSSDNGPWLTKGDHGGKALPFRDGKGSNFEGGVRVPGLFRWTGTIKPAQSDTIASVLDIHPTIAALTGQEIDTYGALDGRDISFLFTDSDKDDGYTLFLTGNGNNSLMTARKGKWKLHINAFSQLWNPSVKVEHNSPKVKASRKEPLLYDLDRDVAETTNIAEEHPDVVKDLLGQMDQFRTSVNAELKKD